MSKERARRRAEREAVAAALAERRAADDVRKQRSRDRRRSLRDLLPARRRGPAGVLAERRRRHLAATLAVLVGVNLLAFAFSPDWGLRALVLVASLLGAPVVHTVLHQKGS